MLACTGCSENEWLEAESAQEETSGQVVRVVASMGDPETRMVVHDDGTKIFSTWESNDNFIVFNAGPQATAFSLVDGDGEVGAIFEGTPKVAYQDHEQLLAVYAKNGYALDDNGNAVIDLGVQSGLLSDQQQILFAQSQFDANSSTTSFIFQNLVSVLKVNVDMPAGVTAFDSLTLVSNNSLVNKATLLLNNSLTNMNSEFVPGVLVNDGNDYNLQYSNNITVKNVTVNGGVGTSYIHVLPVRHFYEYTDEDNKPYYSYNNTYFEPTFIAYVGNQRYFSVKDFGGKTIETGNAYELETPLFAEAPYANEETADGVNVPYEIATADQMYTFMLRSKLNLRNRYGRDYCTCNYVLTSDITLDKGIDWTPINFDSGTFNGNGHTISGKVEIDGWYRGVGLFYDLDCSTIKNLTVSSDVIDTYEHGYTNSQTSILATSAWDATIENCHVTGTVYSRSSATGGILGRSFSNNKIIACSNSGKIVHDTSTHYWYDGGISMGAIVGVVENGCYNVDIVGCYSTASLEAVGIASPVSYHAGILGRVTNETNVKIIGCWASSPLTIEELSTDHILYFGGIAAYMNSGSIQHCYYNDRIATYVTSDSNASVVDCGSFTGSNPTSAQFNDMNAAIAPYGYQYNSIGQLKKVSTIDPFETIEW